MNIGFVFSLIVLNGCWILGEANVNKRSNDQARKQFRDDVNVRLKELSSFYKKLFDSLINITSRDYPPRESYKIAYDLFYKIRNNSGSGFDVILFNCTHPMYLSSAGPKAFYLESNLAEQLEFDDECFTGTDNIWRHQGTLQFVSTYNTYNRTLNPYLLPYATLLDILDYLHMCHDYLILMRHPAYFFKNYHKPHQCSTHQQSTAIVKTTKASNRFQQVANVKLTTARNVNQVRTITTRLTTIRPPVTTRRFLRPPNNCPNGR